VVPHARQRRGIRWLPGEGEEKGGSGAAPRSPQAPPPAAHPPHTHRGALSTSGAFRTSYTSWTLGRGGRRVGNTPAVLPHACQAMPQISQGWGPPRGSPPLSGCPGCTHLRARCTGGTLGTGSAGVTLLPGLSLFAFGTRLPVGTLRGSGRRERVEPMLSPRRGERGQILTGGPANPAGPGAPGSPRSPCGGEMGVKLGGTGGAGPWVAPPAPGGLWGDGAYGGTAGTGSAGWTRRAGFTLEKKGWRVGKEGTASPSGGGSRGAARALTFSPLGPAGPGGPMGPVRPYGGDTDEDQATTSTPGQPPRSRRVPIPLTRAPSFPGAPSGPFSPMSPWGGGRRQCEPS